MPEKYNVLQCGGWKPLINSTVTNYTSAKLIIEKNVKGCTIKSAGPVEDRSKGGNTITKIQGILESP